MGKLKSIWLGFMALLVTLLLVCMVGMFAKTTYNEFSGNHDRYHETPCDYVCPCDTMNFECSCISITDPFVDVTDVLVIQSEMQREHDYLDTFCSMPSDVLSNVVTMVLRQRPYATIETIVDEYASNRKIYDNLRPEEIQTKLDKEPDPVATKQNVNNDTINSTPPNDNGK